MTLPFSIAIDYTHHSSPLVMPIARRGGVNCPPPSNAFLLDTRLLHSELPANAYVGNGLRGDGPNPSIAWRAPPKEIQLDPKQRQALIDALEAAKLPMIARATAAVEDGAHVQLDVQGSCFRIHLTCCSGDFPAEWASLFQLIEFLDTLLSCHRLIG